MKKIFVILFIIGVTCSFAFVSNEADERDANITEIVQGVFEDHSRKLLTDLSELKILIDQDKGDSSSVELIKRKFLECRINYKRNEVFTSFYFLASDQNLNGAVVPEVEHEEEEKQMIVLPTGFQVVEGLIYDGKISENKNDLIRQIDHIKEIYSAISQAFGSKKITERNLFQSFQNEINRHFSLGIASFDTPESKNSLKEISASLFVCKNILLLSYGSEITPEIREVMDRLEKVISYLDKFRSTEEIDFVECLSQFYVPLSTAISNYLIKLPVGEYNSATALRKDQRTLFDGEGFNAFFYNPHGQDKGYTSQVSELGKVLFFDPVLSSNNKRACASCHQPNKAFTDQRPTSLGFHSGQSLSRNAPTILNVALQRNYFWDGRSTDLEDQIGHVLASEKEMMSSYESIVVKLKKSEAYVRLFKSAFNGSEDTTISAVSIANAIAEYERKLIKLDSRFDRNVRGEITDFTDDEKKGLNVFMAKGNCASCHYLPLMSGLIPPYYTKNEFENIGTTVSGDLKNAKLSQDVGRGGKYNTEIYKGAFKTPSLRNVALTAPYMHNGGFSTLEDVIEFYNQGGGAGIGLSVPNQTLPAEKLNLTEEEKRALIAFLHTLNDTTGTNEMPQHLPSFPDEMGLNGRRVGGEY